MLEIDDGFELPTWFVVPDGSDPAWSAQWRAERQRELPEVLSPHGDTAVDDDVSAELQYALDSASGAASALTFQIWPIAHPISVLCHVYVVEGIFSPIVVEGARVIEHQTESRHLGEGAQYSVEQTSETESGTMTLVEVHFAFSDGGTSVVFSLSASLAAIITPALPGLALLKDSVALRSTDGSRFQAVRPLDTPAHDSWPVGKEA